MGLVPSSGKQPAKRTPHSKRSARKQGSRQDLDSESSPGDSHSSSDSD